MAGSCWRAFPRTAARADVAVAAGDGRRREALPAVRRSDRRPGASPRSCTNGAATAPATCAHRRRQDWGYAELLGRDLPASEAAIAERFPDAERIVGGHSLGGQLACCRLALAPRSAQRLWLVASGAPYWRAFPTRTRYWLPLAYRFLPWLADRRGVLPGRRIGFAGEEARGVIRDWARSALSGRYAGARTRVRS